jgi:signal transduction histidine kinase
VNKASRERARTRSATGGLDMVRRSLFAKYLTLLVTAVSVPLLAIGIYQIWSSYRDHENSLIRLQRSQAEAAATRIGEFVSEIEGQIRLVAPLAGSPSTIEQRRFVLRLLLRQVPAITEVMQVDGEGREQLKVSRLAIDRIGGQADQSHEAEFVGAMAHKVYYGPVYFRGESEPYMTIAVAGGRRDAGVVAADVNLKFILDVVSRIKVGENGAAFVVDGDGRLIAHPNISLVLRQTDVSRLPQVERALRGDLGATSEQSRGSDPRSRDVLTAHAGISPPGWLVFVELPVQEAFAPVYASLLVTGLVLLVGLVLAVLTSFALARRMVTPIRALQIGATRIGAGALDYRIDIATGDELEALGEQFNSMATQLQQSYATLERKVDERTHQLQTANLAKSRFLAAASHDLRQPLHALGLFVAQLRANVESAEQTRIISRIDAAITAMNELFNALLDISKLDAEVLKPTLTRFPIELLFKRLETTFADAAREKGVRLRVVPSSAWVRSDFILLERIMLNLASNAVRYTDRGGIVIGARRSGSLLRLELWDSGPGIPEGQRRNIFAEFYQLANPKGDHHGGLGLGLAIVDRLCSLLDHRIELSSVVGKGSRFAILVPLAAAQPGLRQPEAPVPIIADSCHGKLIVVIDDDPMVLDGMRGLLANWGCRVVTADNDHTALARLAVHNRDPDLVISDYRLAAGRTGFEAIAAIRAACRTTVPAFLISGDTAPERLREATASGYRLLHKPVQPMALRAMVSRLLSDASGAGRLGRRPDSSIVRSPADPSPAPLP